MDQWTPDGRPEDGINNEVLQIRLAMEAKQWDSMVDRVMSYLENTRSQRLTAREKTKAKQIQLREETEQKQEEERLKSQGTTPAALRHQRTKVEQQEELRKQMTQKK